MAKQSETLGRIRRSPLSIKITAGFSILFFFVIAGLEVFFSVIYYTLTSGIDAFAIILLAVCAAGVALALLWPVKKSWRDKQRRPLMILALFIALATYVGLGILFSQGEFTTAMTLRAACTPASGLYCSEMVYSSQTGNIIAVIGQDTGTNWTAFALGYVPNQAPSNIEGVPAVPFYPVPTDYYAPQNSLPSGGRVFGTMAVSAPNKVRVGTYISGSIWVCYTTASGVTGIEGGFGECTPIGNSTAEVTYTQLATFYATST